MSDLGAFLLSCADTDEAGAGEWHNRGCGTPVYPDAEYECDCGGPARVLADCAALRAVVENCRSANAAAMEGPNRFSSDPMVDGISGYAMSASWTLRILAQPFKGRPGWQDEWAL